MNAVLLFVIFYIHVHVQDTLQTFEYIHARAHAHTLTCMPVCVRAKEHVCDDKHNSDINTFL